jgi:AmmeMemoRadiSam system protein A
MAIREALRGNYRYKIPGTADPLLTLHAGCFVTLHDAATHRLRGCIGRLQTNDPLIKTIHETAQSALQDPRFQLSPITAEELPRLDLEISILSPLAPANNVLDFDPPNEGIYLIVNGRTGTFLPQVARETGWTREQLLTRLCSEKMGLPADAWQSPEARLLKYQAVVIGPAPFTGTGKPAEQPAAAPQANATVV